jgi:glycosyltransferase involved in cell wall biosynthesis
LKTVRVFLDFLEDRRPSMENYAKELCAGLDHIKGGEYRVETIRPKHFSVRVMPKAWNDRLARYVLYPFQARSRGGDVNHIVDHGYAHLMAVLPGDKTVVTVHDVIPLLASRGLLTGSSNIRRPWLSELSFTYLPRARALVAVSDNTKRDLVRLLGIDERKIHTIPNGLSPDFRPLGESKNILRERLRLPDEAALILITGRAFYKNHVTSVKVLSYVRKLLPDRNVHLICLGKLARDAKQAVGNLSLGEYVKELEFSNQHTVVQLYNAVDCLLFPSLYEGFGWPTIEAMACGVPVVCSNAGALPEVVGDAAEVFDPIDCHAYAAAITNLLTSVQARHSRREKGFVRAGQYKWSDHIDAVLALYRSIV